MHENLEIYGGATTQIVLYFREDFQAYEDLHRSNSPKQVQEFLKELEVWQCYPQCEGE